MFLGLLFAITACFVWGLIFVIPDYLSDFSSMEVVLGRYLSYGIVSTLLFFRKGFKGIGKYPLRAWVFAFTCALLSNLVYYIGIVVGLRFATPTLTVLVVGLAPIMIAFYGNFKEREIAFRDLAIPSIWICFGLVLVNATEVDWSFQGRSFGEYILGMAGVMVALFSWVFYAVQNARFLKKGCPIPVGEWSTVIGVATLFWSVLFGIILSITMPEQLNIAKFCNFSSDTLRFFGCATILGVVCSWCGCFLWSKASIHLPISLMGSLLIFETLFGLLFVFVLHHEAPSWIKLAGILSMIGGIAVSLNSFRHVYKKESQNRIQ